VKIITSICDCVQILHHVVILRSWPTAWCNGCVVVCRGRTTSTTKTTSAIRKSG